MGGPGDNPLRWQRGFRLLQVITVPSGASHPAGSTVTCGNVLYLLLFGWWLSLLYVLVAATMFVTIVGASYGESQIWDPHVKGWVSRGSPG